MKNTKKIKKKRRMEELVARRRAVLGGPSLRLFYDPLPLQVVRGEGVFLYDSEGKRYLDCYNNVASLGHCHPDVTKALVGQAQTLCEFFLFLFFFFFFFSFRFHSKAPTLVT